MRAFDGLKDDLRGMAAIMAKDLRAYYFKPPNISWGILLPFAFVLGLLRLVTRSIWPGAVAHAAGNVGYAFSLA